MVTVLIKVHAPEVYIAPVARCTQLLIIDAATDEISTADTSVVYSPAVPGGNMWWSGTLVDNRIFFAPDDAEAGRVLLNHQNGQDGRG